jgi:hypothetical protein
LREKIFLGRYEKMFFLITILLSFGCTYKKYPLFMIFIVKIYGEFQKILKSNKKFSFHCKSSSIAQ